MKVSGRRVIATASAMALVLGAAACGGSSRGSNDGSEIVIGMPIAQSGYQNAFDGPLLVGAQMAVKEINADGGVDGKTLRIVTANTQSQASQVATAAKQVISDGAQFLIPSQDYDLGSPSARVGETQNPPIPSISLAGDPRFGLLGIGPHTYNVWQGGPVEGGAAATWAYDTKGLRNPYVLTDPTIGYSASLGKYFEYTWSELAGKDSIVGTDTFQNSDPSIATQIARLKSAAGSYDFIFLASYSLLHGACVMS